MIQEENYNKSFAKLHRLLYILRAASFIIAGLSTLPFWNRPNAIITFCFFIKASALFSIAATTTYLLSLRNIKQILIFTVGIFGEGLYFWSTIIYIEGFNKGAMYILASFLVSLAVELKILDLIIKDMSFLAIKKHKHILLQLSLEGLGSLLFLISTAILDINPSLQYLASIFFVSGGICLAIVVPRKTRDWRQRFQPDQAELQILQYQVEK